MLRFLIMLTCSVSLFGSSTRLAMAQMAAALGTASPATHAVMRAPELHYGVFCIQNSGFEATPSRVATGRNPPRIPLPSLSSPQSGSGGFRGLANAREAVAVASQSYSERYFGGGMGGTSQAV
jgi:hypothetical protein